MELEARVCGRHSPRFTDHGRDQASEEGKVPAVDQQQRVDRAGGGKRGEDRKRVQQRFHAEQEIGKTKGL
jgi:hypothetical protein